MDYHLQAAWYTDGYERASAAAGQPVRVLGFIFLAIENEWPHLTNAIMLDDAGIEAGRRVYRAALDKYVECRRSGVWPDYGHDVKIISLPQWKENESHE
jgi:hypothetical protein